MSVRNFLVANSGSWKAIKCASMECSDMIVDNLSINDITTDNVVVNDSVSGAAELDISHTFLDGTKGTIKLQQALNGQPTFGCAMSKASANGLLRAFSANIDAVGLGGPAWLSTSGTINDANGDNSILSNVYDNVNFSASWGVNQGADACSIQMNKDQVNIVSNTAFSIATVSGNQLIATDATGLQTPNLTSGALVADNTGLLSSYSIGSQSFVPVASNNNRCLAFTGLSGIAIQSGGFVQANYNLQFSIGAGVGEPSLFLDTPIAPQGVFATDVVIGAGAITDVGATVCFPLTVAARTTTTQIRIDMIGGQVATYFMKLCVTYPLA